MATTTAVEHPVDEQPSGTDSGASPEQNSSTTAGSESNETSNQSNAVPVVHPPSETTPPDAQQLDPQVMMLLGMFPDFDASLIQSVLHSVAGDQDKAVDVLLGMSDPEYKPTVRLGATETDLDEELARRILREETEQEQRSWDAQPAHQFDQYQPRTTSGPYHPPQGPAQSDGMGQFQEQLGKFAETGRKTINTLFSKVKAKIQEFDNPSGPGQASNSGNPLPRGDSWNTPVHTQSNYQPTPPQPLEGYHVAGPDPSRDYMNHQVDKTNHSADTAASSAAAPSITTPPSATAPPINPVAPVDPSKIGLLPKRPVSLGSSTHPSASNNDDEVEYVENPFEDSDRR